MKIIAEENESLLRKRALEVLLSYIKKAGNTPVLFLSSGGSALEILNEKIEYNILFKNLTLTVLDERFSGGPSLNNFHTLSETYFFSSAKDVGASFISTIPKEKDTMGEVKERFDKALREWKEKNKNGVVIATLGIGADGHTAGIMPFPENSEQFKELFENPDTWVEAYDAEDKNAYPLRITTTISFLETIVDYAVVYALGKEKEKALKSALEEGTLHETPARVIKKMKDVTLLTDITSLE